MGIIFNKIWNFFSKSKNSFKIIILGLQNAGKTTILYRLSLGQLVSTQPTIGSNVEEISFKNVKFQAWDLGGQESMRSVWDAYYVNTDGIIFVIDSSDISNSEESKNELFKILNHEDLKNSLLLVFANKQDTDNCISINELAKIYEFDKIKNHEWHIQACSAKTGEGLVQGLEWLSERLVTKKNTKFPNNPYQINSYNGLDQTTVVGKSNLEASQLNSKLSNPIEESKNSINSIERSAKTSNDISR